jgi:formylglycine-generating enzyme required for sulfatase activity
VLVRAGAVSEESPDAGHLVALPGGPFLMGSEDPGAYAEDGEGPVREVRLGAFRIESRTVTTERFAAFVAETGYVTEAEQVGSAFVFAGLLPDDMPPTRAVVQAPWWREVEGASWTHPEGPWSDLAGRADHPVVQVTWHDAQAFCAWAGRRLPTEAEWEYAARGGLVQQRFPWGSSLTPGGEHRMNVWQGTFPGRNTAKDGYVGTAPADAFAPNGYGLHNMTGNVWEWTADSWSTTWHRTGGAAVLTDPAGPPEGDRRVLRGGSYLCHSSYCWRYRTSARMGSTPDSPTGNAGFRCAADA